MKRVSAAAAAVLGLCLAGWAALAVHAGQPGLARGATTKPVPVPRPDGNAGNEAAQQKFQAAFGEEAQKVSRTSSTDDDVAFAAKLLDGAQKATDARDFQIVLCEKAIEFAARSPAGYVTAKGASELLAALVPERKDSARKKFLDVCERYCHIATAPKDKRTAASRFVDALLCAAEEEMASGDANDAVRLCQRAAPVAPGCGPHTEACVKFRLESAKAHQAAEKELAQLEAALKANPKNSQAAKRLVLLCVLDLDNPAKAAPHLAELAAEEALKANVPLAAGDPGAADEDACLKLRDWYRGLARTANGFAKVHALARSRTYAQRFLQLHTAKDDKTLLGDAALFEIAQELMAAQAKMNGGWLDLLALPEDRYYLHDSFRTRPWKRTADGILSGRDYQGITLLPYEPPAEYDYCATLSVMTEGGGAGLVCVSGGKAFSCILCGAAVRKGGLEMVNGRQAGSSSTPPNPTDRDVPLAPGVRYSVLVQVRAKAVRVCLDGEPIIELPLTNGNALTPMGYLPPGGRCLGIMTIRMPVAVHSLYVREVTGTGRFAEYDGKAKP